MSVGNIGNSYSSWIHNNNTSYAGTKNRPAQTDEEQAEKKTEDMTCREQILAHMEEMAKKVKDGTVEPAFQTGAQTFTIKEWEKLLADFDDAEDALQEQIKEIIAEVEKQAAKEALRRRVESGTADPGEVTNVSVPEAALPNVEAAGSVANPKPAESGSAAASQAAVGSAAVSAAAGAVNEPAIDEETEDLEEIGSLLTDEVTKSTFPTDDPKQKHWFVTCYGQDGISCKEAWFDGTKWVNRDCWDLKYTEPGQYEKVMAFLQRFPQDANLRFAAHKEFWEDFLAGKIDEDDFVNFFETSTDENGVPDYTYEKDGSTYIDREKAKYAKYMNDFGAHFYTGEEMQAIREAVMRENRRGLKKISDYDGQMPIPGGVKDKDVRDEEDGEEKSRIITKPDGSTVLQIETNFGVMEIEIAEAQKFGEEVGRTMPASPFAHMAAYENGEV